MEIIRLTWSSLLLRLYRQKSPLIQPISNHFITSAIGVTGKSIRCQASRKTTALVHIAWHRIPSASARMCACAFMCLSLCLSAGECYWHSNIEQRLLNCSCQKFSQDEPLLPFINASLSCQLIYVRQTDPHTLKHGPIWAVCIACNSIMQPLAVGFSCFAACWYNKQNVISRQCCHQAKLQINCSSNSRLPLIHLFFRPLTLPLPVWFSTPG